MNQPAVVLRPNRVAWTLGAGAALLVLADLAGQCCRYLFGRDHVLGLVDLFDLDQEKNIPTLFSVGLLAFASLLLWLTAWLKRLGADAETSRWAVLALGFTAMAVDEGWSFHERLVKPVRGMLGEGTLGVFYFAWVVPALVLVLLVGVLFLRFLVRLPARTRWRFLLAAACYLGGTIGMELLGGRYSEAHGQDNLTYNLIAALEESLEMGGSILFIHALLDYLAVGYGEATLQFRRRD